jgi:hypothetical protein
MAAWCLLCLLLASGGAGADELRVQVIPVVGEPIAGRLERWDDRVSVVAEGEPAASLPVDEVRTLTRQTETPRIPRPSSGCTVRLTNDDLLHADDVRMADETLTLRWKEPAAGGELELPLAYVRSLLFHHDGPAEPETPRDNLDTDSVLLTNRDRVTGEWTALDGEAFEVETVLGPLRIERARVQQLDLNPQLADEPLLPERHWVVSLQDGSHLTVEGLSLTDSAWRLQLASGPERELPADAIQAIRSYSDTVVSLTALDPLETENRSYFGERFEPLRNRNVLGRNMRIGGEPVPRGWGTSSLSRITFAVPEGARWFSTGIGLDDAAGELGGVSASVVIDGQAGWSQERITLREGVLHVGPLEVHGAERVTLRVDFGPRADVQDFVNWIDPVFLHATGHPETTPTGLRPGTGIP